MTKYYVLFPAYNEHKAIERVLRETDKLFRENGLIPLELVVVDDGSHDQTAQIVKQLQSSLPITLLQHEHNKGLGAALNTGLLYIIKKAKSDDVIVTTESDGCQDTSKLILLAKAVLDGADFAVATPLVGEGFRGVPFYRRFLSRGANMLYSLLFPIKGLDDYTNLNRAFRANVLIKSLQRYGEEHFIDRVGFEAVPDIILKLRDQKPVVKEVPIIIDFSNAERHSSMDVLKTIMNSLILCWNHLVNIKPREK